MTRDLNAIIRAIKKKINSDEGFIFKIQTEFQQRNMNPETVQQWDEEQVIKFFAVLLGAHFSKMLAVDREYHAQVFLNAGRGDERRVKIIALIKKIWEKQKKV